MNDVELLKINGVTVGNFRDTRYANNSMAYYGANSEAAATVERTVEINDYQLKKGNVVSVKFTNSVPTSATLNVNQTGAKAIYYKGSALQTGFILAGDTAQFVYNGTQYDLISIDAAIDILKDLRGKTVYTT